MRNLALFLLFLILSVVFGILMVNHPGYFLLVYQPWMVQMPLWLAFLGFIVILILFYVLIVCVDKIEFLWFRLNNWLMIRREHQSYSKTQHGLTSLIEGRWQKAERLLLAGASKTIEPLINYLGAAFAAHEQHAYERRDTYLRKAYHIAPSADLAIGLTQAELELKQDQLEQAAATINHLRQLAPRHPRVLKLLEKVYVRLGDWKSLQTLLPQLQRAKILSADDYVLFEKNIYSEMLHRANNKTLIDVEKIWRDVPRYLRKNPDVVYAYVQQLLRFKEYKPVEELIRQSLKLGWHPGLVNSYADLPFTNLNRQLVIVGAWLKLYGPRPELLLTLAKLCVRVQLWGKAKDYFEKCLAYGPNAEASLEYGQLLEQLGDEDLARQKYRLGLQELSLIKT